MRPRKKLTKAMLACASMYAVLIAYPLTAKTKQKMRDGKKDKDNDPITA
jgi:hypothetical protein